VAATNRFQYLWVTLTQGSNDAFVQNTMATALLNTSGICFLLRELVVEWPAPFANGADLQLSLTRKTFAAVPALTEKSLIWSARRTLGLTTSGAALINRVERFTWNQDDNLTLVEDPLYWQLDSASTSASNVVNLRIGVVQAKITDLEKVALVAASLQ